MRKLEAVISGCDEKIQILKEFREMKCFSRCCVANLMELSNLATWCR